MASAGNNSSTRQVYCCLHEACSHTSISDIVFLHSTPPGVKEEELFNYFKDLAKIKVVKVVENPGGAPIKIVALRCYDQNEVKKINNKIFLMQGYYVRTQAAYICETKRHRLMIHLYCEKKVEGCARCARLECVEPNVFRTTEPKQKIPNLKNGEDVPPSTESSSHQSSSDAEWTVTGCYTTIQDKSDSLVVDCIDFKFTL